MPLTVAIKNALLDALPSITHVSAHQGLPDDAGSNEISGGAYARVAISFAAAANGQRIATTNPALAIPGGKTVSYVGYWSSGTFVGSSPVYPSLFGADGTYTVTQAKLSF